MSGLVNAVLSLHGFAAAAVVFTLAALEASAFVGLFVPGELAVILAGVLAYSGQLSLTGAILAGSLGAIVGDSVGYEIGRHFGARMLDTRLGRHIKRERVERAKRYLREKGGKAVLIGRFTAALRVLVPGLAGMAGMRYRTFFIYNVVGGALWATAMVFVGYAAGTSWQAAAKLAGRGGLILLIVVVVIAGIAAGARKISHNEDRVRAWIARQMQRPAIRRVAIRHRRLFDFVAARLRPQGAYGASLTITLVLLVGAGWAFGAVLQDVLGRDELAAVDGPALRFFAARRTPALTAVMRVVTFAGSHKVLLPVLTIAGAAWWLRVRKWPPLARVALVYGGTLVLSEALKVLVARARPPGAMAVGTFTGYSFPSGHAAQSIAAYCGIAALASARVRRWSGKVAVWAAALAVAALVGLSRLYLGAHWLSDVLGGFALAATWLLAVFALSRALPAASEDTFGARAPAASAPPGLD